MADETKCPNCDAVLAPNDTYCGSCGARLGSDPEANKDKMLGSIVGQRFLVKSKIGAGGMGVVYRAEQTAIGRPVALKVLHPQLTTDENLHARFHNEAAASSRLNHPNTITIYDFGETEDKTLYIAMEFIEGKSLDDEIQHQGAIEWRRACKITQQICGSLQDAHDNNIVHRDLKPENVMLCNRGADVDVVKVLDFGIAKMREGDGVTGKPLTQTGMVFGTPQFMSPEQVRGEKVDGRSDIYSLGVILYQMITGELPFTAETPMGILTKHLVDIPKPPRELKPELDLPVEIEDLLMSMLAKDVDQRPQTMGELEKRFRRFAAGRLTMGARAKTAGTVVAAEKKRGVAIPAIIVVVILLAAAGAVAVYLGYFPTNGAGALSSAPKVAVPTEQSGDEPPEVDLGSADSAAPTLSPVDAALVTNPEVDTGRAVKPKPPKPKPPVDDTKPPVDDTKPPVDDTKPPVDDTKPPVDDTKPPVDDTKPPVDDTKPPVEPEVKPKPVEYSCDIRRLNAAKDGKQGVLINKKLLRAKAAIKSCVNNKPPMTLALPFRSNNRGRLVLSTSLVKQKVPGCLKRHLEMSGVKAPYGGSYTVVTKGTPGAINECTVAFTGKVPKKKTSIKKVTKKGSNWVKNKLAK